MTSTGLQTPDGQRSYVMAEFFRSGAIMLMGLTVMAAGVAVVFYG
jgi:hypothetical protein